MSEPRTSMTSIKVKSPTMLAQMIAWTQDEFWSSVPQGPNRISVDRPRVPVLVVGPDRSGVDDENDWSDV